jgi:hypothetical protein
MSRGLTDAPEPEEPENGPSVQELDQAMRDAYGNIYDLSVRVDTLERILANFIKEPQDTPKKKWKKGI